MYSINWPASMYGLHTSAGRALQRERRKTFFELLRNCLNCDSTLIVTYSLHYNLRTIVVTKPTPSGPGLNVHCERDHETYPESIKGCVRLNCIAWYVVLFPRAWPVGDKPQFYANQSGQKIAILLERCYSKNNVYKGVPLLKYS